MAIDYREEVVSTEGGLVGILTLPQPQVNPSRPAVLILNSGNMHRVGTGRISVTLARHLASLGHIVLRFDHASVGDSAVRRDSLDLEKSRISEIKEMVTLVGDRFNTDRFVLYGLCSGARDAYQVALTDNRIHGVAMIDGYSYTNLRYHLTLFTKRLADPMGIARSLLRKVGLLSAPARADKAQEMWVQEWPDDPPREVIERGYQSLVARSVALFVVYTGAWSDSYNYRRQFLDIFRKVDFGERLTLLYLPNAAHTLPNPRNRRLVIDGVCSWMTDMFTAEK